jgi:hypothetical membrane protein
MRTLRRRDGITLASLGCGMAVPILYYGTQAAAAPSFPGFSFLGTTASELGSDLSTHPAIFNIGAMLTGLAAVAASPGLLMALRRLGTHPILAWPSAIAVAITGLSSVRAGMFPLPDPRHGGHPSVLIAMLLVPFALAAALWKRDGSPALKAYLIATIVLLVAMVPIMSGMTGLDTHAFRGLFQRIFALTVFTPIGVGACVLAMRVRVAQSNLDAASGAIDVSAVAPIDAGR